MNIGLTPENNPNFTARVRIVNRTGKKREALKNMALKIREMTSEYPKDEITIEYHNPNHLGIHYHDKKTDMDDRYNFLGDDVKTFLKMSDKQKAEKVVKFTGILKRCFNILYDGWDFMYKLLDKDTYKVFDRYEVKHNDIVWNMAQKDMNLALADDDVLQKLVQGWGVRWSKKRKDNPSCMLKVIRPEE